MHINNLNILANYLDGVPQDQFTMRTFARMDTDSEIPLHAHECKTAGCAIGWAPMAGFEILDTDQAWADYSERVFDLNFGSRAWAWCFAGTWARVDDSPAGAAKRIRYLIEHGAVPFDANQQMFGTTPYIFHKETT